jgi:hypothetical protein
VHCYLIYLSYYGSVWPEDDFFKLKLVASLHIDNKLMCFRLILILSNFNCPFCTSLATSDGLDMYIVSHVRKPLCMTNVANTQAASTCI